MFQLPPGMNYKKFQAAGSPGYRSDAMPFQEGGSTNAAGAQHPKAQSIPGYASDGRGGYTNAAGGSVRHSSRFGNAQPKAPSMPSYDQAQPTQPSPRDSIFWSGKKMTFEDLTREGYHPAAAREMMAPKQSAPSIPRYDQAQPMQPQGRGTPYPGGPLGMLAPDAAPGTRDTPGPGHRWPGPAGPSPQQPFDQNRWQMGGWPSGTPQLQPSQPSAYAHPGQQPMGPDGGPWRTGGRLPRPDQMGQSFNQPSFNGGTWGSQPGGNFSPFGGSPFSDSWVKQPRNDMFGGGQYTNGQGQGFMGSMSFAPGTPASYQNQAYGNWANSQGYFQQPQFSPFAPRYQGGGMI